MLAKKTLIDKLGQEYEPMINKISIPDFTKCIAQYSGLSMQYIKDEIIEDYLTKWATNKKYLFDLFGGELRADMPITYRDEQRDYKEQLLEIGRKHIVYYPWFDMFSNHCDNKIRYQNMGWNERSLLDTVFPGKIEGTSITHFFKNKLNASDEIVTEIGRVFENAELNATYTLSIDPVDIMLSSENPYNWTSCYRLENFEESHADGCLAGVLDKSTVISYVWTDAGKFVLYNKYDFKNIRYKRLRITLAFNSTLNAIHFNNVYPWKRDCSNEFMKMIRNKVEAFICEKTGKEDVWRKYQFEDDLTPYRRHEEYGYSEYSGDNVYILKNEDEHKPFEIYNEEIICPCGCGQIYGGSDEVEYMEFNGEGHICENWYEESCDEEWCDYAGEYVECDHDCENCRSYLWAHAHCEIDGEEHACSERDLWDAERDGDADFDSSSVIECNPEACANCPFYKLHHPELQEADNAAEEPADQDPTNEESAAAPVEIHLSNDNTIGINTNPNITWTVQSPYTVWRQPM